MEVLFTVDSRHHGTGEILFTWNPKGNYVASAGSSRVVQIFDREGELVDQIVPPSPSACTALEWNYDGSTLAIIQAHSAIIVFWDVETKERRLFDVACKDIVFIQWSKLDFQMAIGTGKGVVEVYNDSTRTKRVSISTPKKTRLLCGAWNNENKLAYAYLDPKTSTVGLRICSDEGVVNDQMKVSRRPVSILFGGRKDGSDRILSVNMEEKTIFLYDMDQRDNALELAFQERYGKIVSYQWFGNGLIVAGFSLGFVVVISTHLKEIGQEQYCARIHAGDLQNISYCATNGLIATSGNSSIKVISMTNWQLLLEVATDEIDREVGIFTRIDWTQDGRVLSVSSRLGCLYNFSIRLADKHLSKTNKLDRLASHLIRPMSPFSFAIATLIVIFTMAGITAHRFDITLVELVEALLGRSAAF